MSRQYDEWMASLTIVGEEAYMPSEHVPRPYRRLTDEEREHYNRDWMRRYRARLRAERAKDYVHTYASLHDLACTGPTKATGCRCRKLTVYRRNPRYVP